MVNAKLIVVSFELMQLRLRCHQLTTNHVHLLRRRELLGGRLVRFAWRGCLSSNVVERILVVHLEVWVLEFPGLWSGQSQLNQGLGLAR